MVITVKKTIFWVLLCCQIFSVAGLFFSCRFGGPPMSLPSAGDLKSVAFEQEGNSGNYWDPEWIASFLSGLRQGKNTGKKSVSDSPSGVSSVKVTLHFSGGGSSVLFVYEKNGRFFAEQPYAGIWEISKETYGKLS